MSDTIANERVAQEANPKRPNRLRKAYCELTGGHNNEVLGAYAAGTCWAIRLHCVRCGKETAWYSVPKIKEREPARP